MFGTNRARAQRDSRWMFIKRATKATRRKRRSAPSPFTLAMGGRGDASGVAYEFHPRSPPAASPSSSATLTTLTWLPGGCMRVVVSIHVCALLLLQQRMRMQRWRGRRGWQKVAEESDERDDLCRALLSSAGVHEHVSSIFRYSSCVANF